LSTLSSAPGHVPPPPPSRRFYLPAVHHFQAGLSLPQILRSRKRVNGRSCSPFTVDSINAPRCCPYCSFLAAKSSAYTDFVAAADTVLSIAKESETHVAFSAQWGVDLAELECTPESPACTAYGAYIMNVGLQGMISILSTRDSRLHFCEGDAASLMIALAACLIGYGQVGLWLQRETSKEQPQSWMKIENNPYRKWIEDYSGEGYQSAVKIGIGACVR
jgi:hypothetical protein